MRYLVGLVFVLALSVMGCSETEGMGGRGGAAGIGGHGGTAPDYAWRAPEPVSAEGHVENYALAVNSDAGQISAMAFSCRTQLWVGSLL